MNFYAMANNGGTAWSPILGQGNFPKASRFGKVTWATKEWLATRAASALDGGAPDGGAAARDGGAATRDGGAVLLPRLQLNAGEAGAPHREPVP